MAGRLNFQVGDRVAVEGSGCGTVAYIGEDLSGLPAGIWVGVVYDEPLGKNDGSVKGVRYFKCKPNYGSMIRPDKIRVLFAENAMAAMARGQGAPSGKSSGPPIGHAARSHELNQAYMENFESAYALLQEGITDPSALHDRKRTTLAVAKSKPAPTPHLDAAIAVDGLSRQLEVTSITEPLSGAWTRGPIDPAGTLLDLSQRPNTCISVRGNEAVIGSTDHALYCVDIAKAKQTRTLYTKACGHTEWVTCVSHLVDGRILSGGMDGKLCLWNAAGARCVDLQGHTASVSSLKADAQRCMAVTGGYDNNVLVWDLTKHHARSLACTLRGHVAPVLCLAVGPAGRIVSGDRDGAAILWDTAAAAAVGPAAGGGSRRTARHGGHVTSLGFYDETTWLSGAQDGRLRVWDVRQEGCVQTIAAHVLPTGTGAIGDIAVAGGIPGLESRVVVTAGADGRLQVLDPAKGWQPRHTLTGHRDFIYTMAVGGATVFSGAGDGSLIAHDLRDGRTCYGLGANKAAVRCIAVSRDHQTLVTSGDDGKAVLYNFH